MTVSVVSQLLFLATTFFLFFRLLGILDGYFREGERSQGIGEHGAGTEVDFRTLDEGGIVVFLSEGPLSAEAHLKGAQLAQAHDFAILDGFGHHIFKGYEDAKRYAADVLALNPGVEVHLYQQEGGWLMEVRRDVWGREAEE